MARIKIGSCYIARLSKGDAPVRIESVHEDGGNRRQDALDVPNYTN